MSIKRKNLINFLAIVSAVAAVASVAAPRLMKRWKHDQPAAIPELTGRVVDNAGLFTRAAAESVAREIEALEKATKGGQMVVLAIPTLGGRALEEYSLAVANRWGIGRKGVDDGALLLLVTDDRLSRLEIGRGWEGVIPDARAGDILRSIAPKLAAKDYLGAAVSAVRSVRALVTGEGADEVLQRLDSDERERTRTKGALGALIFIICGGLLAVVMVVMQKKGKLPTIESGGLMRRRGSFGSRGGGFSGGGGRFGGGGASGRW